MCDFFSWRKGDEQQKEARNAFKDAMVLQFNSMYGTDVHNIENWHTLCIALGIEPLPTTIKDCKEASGCIRILKYSLSFSNLGCGENSCQFGRPDRFVHTRSGAFLYFRRTAGLYYRVWEVFPQRVSICRWCPEIFASQNFRLSMQA
jgi:hypothetical protein